MEAEAVTMRRRLNIVASHFPSSGCDSVSAAHLLPLNCSGSLNSVIQRRDNRTYFARQASSAQSCFARQASNDELCGRGIPQSQNVTPPKCSGTRANKCYDALDAPSFARPASGKPPMFSTPTKEQPPLFSPPMFSTPTKEQPPLSCCMETGDGNPRQGHKLPAPVPPKIVQQGSQRSPRSDVAEYARSYTIAVELPGVSIDDVRVEINDQNLIVTARRPAISQMMTGRSRDSIFAYHKREILPGPYQVSWPLPVNANKDGVCAEFSDGLLRIVIPKH